MVSKRHANRIGPFFAGKAQPKLIGGQQSDTYEQEADRIAEQVTSTSEHVQTKTNEITPSEAPSSVSELLHSSGQPLDSSTREFFEPRFGHDFSKVRIHDDDKAAASANAINARAFTIGEHIVLGENQFSPQSSDGRNLLAHELAHTIQQGPVVQRKPAPERLSFPWLL